ncbi:type II toxin-antitoxin system RelE/ParE family toxin [Sphingobacterium sp. UT-1RO-CII-1]|uniref:type II toxin-antitoxin system RelE/ParE family toxin n=1 Tax=Sphingobacterium sp. UT-1RO-CII-1 TaxID=2995225 RepID=UPI00227BEFFB|nr:type II toxin-antitoxin system RelE/ParE family toxin [Sphingobacterium sp. UT-1RO-CII-1]MCY4779102.1 type II toxin-antitoxin system RelE/ParE family toxin [Sphingobacterium sp. UT-1RO-CII-1]
MAKYILTNKAVEDISDIWDYTYEVWSESQADTYYELLIETCQKITNNPAIGKSYHKISIEIFGTPIGKHIIFYRKLETDDIEVIRILHERMDFKNRINE